MDECREKHLSDVCVLLELIISYVSVCFSYLYLEKRELCHDKYRA